MHNASKFNKNVSQECQQSDNMRTFSGPLIYAKTRARIAHLVLTKGLLGKPDTCSNAVFTSWVNWPTFYPLHPFCLHKPIIPIKDIVRSSLRVNRCMISHIDGQRELTDAWRIRSTYPCSIQTEVVKVYGDLHAQFAITGLSWKFSRS